MRRQTVHGTKSRESKRCVAIASGRDTEAERKQRGNRQRERGERAHLFQRCASTQRWLSPCTFSLLARCGDIFALQERVEALLQCAPTAEDLESIAPYDGDPALLATCEHFFYVVRDVPFFTRRLEALRGRHQFHALTQQASAVVESLAAAVAELVRPLSHFRVTWIPQGPGLRSIKARVCPGVLCRYHAASLRACFDSFSASATF